MHWSMVEGPKGFWLCCRSLNDSYIKINAIIMNALTKSLRNQAAASTVAAPGVSSLPLRRLAGPIPNSRPQLEREDFSYVEEILHTRQVAQGQFVEQLERRVSEFLGVRYAVAVSHGTAALHLALLALDIGAGDEVIIPSYNCAALLHATNYVGAKPVFVDIDAQTFNPDAVMVRRCITAKTKAVLLAHTFGFPADIESMQNLGVPIIEDCAHALGAYYRRKPVGSWGNVTTLSFYATKMICSGEGGMVCTNDSRLAKRVRQLTTPEPLLKKYEVRYNYKMSDLAAGLALSQFQRLPDFVRRRREIAAQYRGAIDGSHLRIQQAVAGSEPSYYRFVVKTQRPAVMMRLAAARGIICDRPVFRPLHRYEDAEGLAKLKNTDSVWRSGVSVPIYPDLSDQEVSHVLEFLVDIGRDSR